MRRITYIALPIIALVILAAFLRKNGFVSADVPTKPESSRNISLIIENKKVSFALNRYNNNGKIEYALSTKKIIGQKSSVKLAGFESTVSLCKDNPIKLQKGYAICLIGNVGAHSQNLELVQYFDHNLTDIKVTNGDSIESNVVSDVPSFSFTDKNNDSFLDLIADQRDYDTDPLNNSIRSNYLSSESGFVFDGKENITYNK